MSTEAAQRVYMTRYLPAAVEATRAAGLEVEVFNEGDDTKAMPREELLESAKGVSGLVVMLSDKVDAELLDAIGPQLKVVSTYSVGYDHIDTEACKERGVTVTNTPGVLTNATADIAAGLILSAARRFREGIDAVRDGEWTTWTPTWLCGLELSGSTLGIVGAGRIGQATARRMHGFGMKTVYTSRTAKPEFDAELDASHVTFDELLETADVISVHCALTDETRQLFNTDAFAKMKPTAVFVNTSRGDVVDQDALISALKEGVIAAAGLDVTTPEPLPHTHELANLPNCVIVPHIGSATVATRTTMAVMVGEAVAAVLTGGEAENVVV